MSFYEIDLNIRELKETLGRISSLIIFAKKDTVYVCMCTLSRFSRLTLCGPMDQRTRLLCPEDSSGKNTRGDFHTSSRDPPNRGIKLVSVMSYALTDRFFATNAIWEAL